MLEEIARGTKSAFERIDRRLDRIDQRLDAIATEQRSDYRWLLAIVLGGFGMMLTAYIGLLGVMAKGFHWL